MLLLLCVQYNGPLNFVGQAVVILVCQQILNASAETAAPVPVPVSRL